MWTTHSLCHYRKVGIYYFQCTISAQGGYYYSVRVKLKLTIAFLLSYLLSRRPGDLSELYSDSKFAEEFLVRIIKNDADWLIIKTPHARLF